MYLLLFALTLISCVVLLAFQNLDSVPVKFLNWDFTMSKFTLVGVAFMAGSFLSALWHTLKYVSSIRLIAEISKKLQEQEMEIEKKNERICELEKEIDSLDADEEDEGDEKSIA